MLKTIKKNKNKHESYPAEVIYNYLFRSIILYKTVKIGKTTKPGEYMIDSATNMIYSHGFQGICVLNAINLLTTLNCYQNLRFFSTCMMI